MKNTDNKTLCAQLSSRFLEFFNFNMSMAKKDIIYTWKLTKFIEKVVPTLNEIKILIANGEISNKELILVKTLLEIHEIYALKTQSPHFKDLFKSIYPLMKRFYKMFKGKQCKHAFEEFRHHMKIMKSRQGKFSSPDMMICGDTLEDCFEALKEKKNQIKCLFSVKVKKKKADKENKTPSKLDSKETPLKLQMTQS